MKAAEAAACRPQSVLTCHTFVCRYQPGGLWSAVEEAVTAATSKNFTFNEPAATSWQDDVRTPLVNIGDNRYVQHLDDVSSLPTAAAAVHNSDSSSVSNPQP